MALTVGARLGPYEITAPIGAGGMGEVYKATDIRLHRTVAVKVLPGDVASNPDLKQRFEREAKTLAALSHPHICPVFDVGRHDHIDFLVMECLEGETLEQRLKKGALPLELALQVGIHIADALAAAHRAGIVHRDLKPGNVMLTKTGAKLLDFGLAKLQPTPVLAGTSLAATVSSPLTDQGTILGTLHYMAPEQVEGGDADMRSDIFGLGAVVYEMVTGKRAFEGKTAASVVAAILEREPPAMSTLQPLTPSLLDHVVRRCLAKDPNDRWQAASDVMRELRWAAESGSPTSAAGPAGGRRRTRERFVWISVVVALVVALGMVVTTGLRRVSPLAMRVEVSTPATADPVSLALSPDGLKIVFAATSRGQSQLWLRSLVSGAAEPLARTEGAIYPFWSPDSRSIGFFADGSLKRIDIEAGFVQVLAKAPVGRGGSWNRDGTILFAPQGPIFRMPAAGGDPVAVTQIESTTDAVTHRSPQFLPDGRHFLYYVLGGAQSRGVYVGQIDGGQTRRLVADASAGAVYATSGHLFYVRQDTLFAQQFDPVGLELTGDPVPIAQQIASGPNMVAVSASTTGHIAYRTGAGVARRQLVWLDRSGKPIATVGESGFFVDPVLSPDEATVALRRDEDGVNSVWLLDTKRGVFRQFASQGGFPIWSPDGSRIVLSLNQKGVTDLYLKPFTGAGREELLLATTQLKTPADWSPDGRFVLYRSVEPQTGNDLFAVSLDSRKPVPVALTPFDERDAQFSPDGQWIAFVSNESGRPEVYVQPFPGPGQKHSISSDGGGQPRWRRDGTELFYVALDGQLMAVPIERSPLGDTISGDAPVPLFPANVGAAVQSNNRQQYMVSSDGQRFLMNTILEEAASPITLLLNWGQ